MRVTILGVGSVKGVLGAAVLEYEERARRYWKLSVVEVEGGTGRGKGGEAEDVMAAEEGRLLSRVADGAVVVALTRNGTGMGSRALAELLQESALRSVPEVTFVIGGAFGLGGAILGRANRRLALSAFTLPHEMARLLLAEQIYRAGTILRNEPYHKGT